MRQKNPTLLQKYIVLFFIAATSLTLFAQVPLRPATWATPVTGLNLYNMYQLDEDVYRSEQPSTAAFAALEQFGITEVINLRYWHNDHKHAQATSIRIIDIPMNAHHINDHDVILALSAIQNRKGKIAFHCRHGSDRTGAIAAIYRVVFQNWSKEEAIDELKNGGYGFHRIYTNIPKYIQQVDVEAIRSRLNQEAE